MPIEGLKPPVRWLKAYWDEEEIWFFFEIDEDAWTLRQVELQGPAETPIAAAALAEWLIAKAEGHEALAAYSARYGRLTDQKLSTFDPDAPLEEITRGDFEAAWRRARAHLERKR